MQNALTMDQIRTRYPDQRVLIEYAELDEELRVGHGSVLQHSPDRDKVYQPLLVSTEATLAVEYTGEIPHDLAILL